MLNQTSYTSADLVWRLKGFSYPEKAVEFLKRFEGSFCVFSQSLRQLYSNYELIATKHGAERTVVTLPNVRAHHDTFFNIPAEAIVPTGIIVCPGEIKGHSDWLLCQKSTKSGRWKSVELNRGFKQLQVASASDDPFLPVIMTSDLRRSPQRDLPIMHLQRISIKKLASISALQRSDIKLVIREKLGLNC